MNKKFGLIGEKLSHSLSPSIHNEIFEFCNVKGSYELFEVPKGQLKNFITFSKENKFSGLNVTIPYKIEVMKYLDEISREAQEIGAVNTILFKSNKLYGFNTDYYGIMHTFKKFDIGVSGKTAVVLGSGGASTAVLQFLKDNNCTKVFVVVRDKKKAVDNDKLKNLNIIEYNELPKILEKDVFINCTPVGMFPNVDASPVEESFVQGFDFVFDLIYNPESTVLLKYAEKNNITHCGGLYMLVSQAVYAEAIWNDISPKETLTEEIYNNLRAGRLINGF